jgi:hypothetical protein
MGAATIPNTIDVIVANTKMKYNTVEYVEMVTGIFKKNGFANATEDNVKIQIWNILNNRISLGKILKNGL